MKRLAAILLSSGFALFACDIGNTHQSIDQERDDAESIDSNDALASNPGGADAVMAGLWEIDADPSTLGDGPDGLDHIYNLGGERVTLHTSNRRWNVNTAQFDTPVEGSIKFQVNSAGDYIQVLTDTAGFVFGKYLEAAKDLMVKGDLELTTADTDGGYRMRVNGSALIGDIPTPDPLPSPLGYKLWVRGPAFFNGLPAASGNNGQTWTTAVVIAANDGLTSPTDASPNREMRLLGSGPVGPDPGNYGGGISWGLAPQPNNQWRAGAWSSQQFLLGYWGQFLWLRGGNKTPNGNPSAFNDADLRNLVRFSADTDYHPLAVFGNVWAQDFIKNSDRRLKRNIRTLSGAREQVLALRGTEYEFAHEKHPDRILPRGTHLGFIAQEVKEVNPLIVSEDEDGLLSLSYDSFIPLLVEAFKEQDGVISAQGKADADQAAELAALRRELDQMRRDLAAVKNECRGDAMAKSTPKPRR
ncbi:MAG: tail fiber domain-containing protein [Myxococcales bacterium]|nr:tail fiber domain-containing protein [Myxococcales bacterium]